MSGNSFGKIFRLTTFGESHGSHIGGVLDGCPAGLEIDLQFIQNELDRRKPGQYDFETPRNEDDLIEIISGVFNGQTTGSPICFIIPNNDAQSDDYNQLRNTFRPSHADYVYQHKYGVRDHRGGGRASARETTARVAAGAIARLLLKKYQIPVSAFTSSIGNISMPVDLKNIDLNAIENSIVRCPDNNTSVQMLEELDEIRNAGDTCGGIITCLITNVPLGLGEPVFDKLQSDLAKAMLSIPSVKGFEYGSGFSGTRMRGSQHNDAFILKSEEAKGAKLGTTTNYSGGIQGGISNGEDIYFNVAFKPVSSLGNELIAYDEEGGVKRIQRKGRHDVCVVPRAVPIVEAMCAIVIADHLLRLKAYQ